MEKVKRLIPEKNVYNDGNSEIEKYMYMYQKAQRDYIEKIICLQEDDENIRNKEKIHFLVQLLNASSILISRGVNKNILSKLDEFNMVGAIAHPAVRNRLSDVLCNIIEPYVKIMADKFPETIGVFYQKCAFCENTDKIPYTSTLLAMDVVVTEMRYYNDLRYKNIEGQENKTFVQKYNKTKESIADILEVAGITSDELVIDNHKIVINIIMNNLEYKKYFTNMYGDDCINISKIREISLNINKKGRLFSDSIYLLPEVGLCYERNSTPFTDIISARPIYTPNFYEDNIYMLFRDSFKDVENAVKNQDPMNDETKKSLRKTKELEMIMIEDGYSSDDITEIFKACENRCRLYYQE